MNLVGVNVATIGHDATDISFATKVLLENGIQSESDYRVKRIIQITSDGEAGIHPIADLADAMLCEGEVVPIHQLSSRIIQKTSQEMIIEPVAHDHHEANKE